MWMRHPTIIGESMDERTFFSNGEVNVTNARFIANGQTYAMSGITSVKSFRQDPSIRGPILLATVGVIAILMGRGNILIGVLMVGAAVLWWRSLKPEFSVLLHSASGEMKAFSSKDGSLIATIITALNDAIVHRG
jgi:hypothetical protein